MNDIELINKYEDISISNKPKIPQYHGDMFIDVEAEYLIRKELQQRIDKSIEYIEEHYPTSTINYQDDKYKLLNILKGSEK